MSYPQTLEDFRKDILEELEQASLILEANSQNYHEEIHPVKWATRLLRTARDDLQYLWDGTDQFFEFECPLYLDLICYTFSQDEHDGSLKIDRFTIENLEELSFGIATIRTGNTSKVKMGTKIVCTLRDVYGPLQFTSTFAEIATQKQKDWAMDHHRRVQRKKRLNDTLDRKPRPSQQDVCRSGLAAALALCFRYSNWPIMELVGLLAACLQSPREEFVPLLQTNLRGRRCVPRATKETPSLFPAPLDQAIRTFRFPGAIPQIVDSSWSSLTSLRMDMSKPHGQMPVTTNRIAVRGSFMDTAPSWLAISTFADAKFIRVLDDFLVEASKAPSKEMSDLVSHWSPFCHYINAIAVSDTRLTLREMMDYIEKKKYINTADPKITFANMCAMYINHVAYWQRLLDDLVRTAGDFPETWKLPDAVKLSLNWPEETLKDLREADLELKQVQEEIKKVREMIMDQRTLVQARKTTILTVLASIYIPIGFVATFFGMNTREINDSSWPLKRYYAIAFPLAGATILVPLYWISAIALTLRTGTYILRKIEKGNMLTIIIHQILLLGTFAINLYQDEQWVVYIKTWGFIFGFGIDVMDAVVLMILAGFAGGILFRAIKSAKEAYNMTGSRPTIASLRNKCLHKYRGDVLEILIFVFFMVSLVVPFIEIPFYIAYYINFCHDLHTKRKKRKSD